MMWYVIKTPWWVKKLYADYLWEMPVDEKALYLTFDDGPHETATPFVLDTLKQYDAKATFFCIGKNVEAHPDIYARILMEGHKTGNHTFNHLNGWKVSNEEYISNIYAASKYIDSNLFRPPYGRISKFQARLLQQRIKLPPAKDRPYQHPPFNIVMWTVLSGDFDIKLTPEKALQNVILSSKPGSIIVFHDSAKAYSRLEYALPRCLEYFKKEGYNFKSL